MSNIENEIKKYLDTINQNYSKFLSCYNLFMINIKSRAPNILWEEKAKNNLVIINKYNSVFATLDLILDLAIFELAKIFEKQNPKYKNKTISLITLLDFLDKNRITINKNIKLKFDEKCQNLQQNQLHFLSIEEIINEEWWVKLLNNCFFNQINEKIIEIENKTTHLKKSRDNRWHNLNTLKPAKFTYNDLDKINESFLEIFNLINSCLWNWIYDYSYYSKDTDEHFTLLIEDLLKFHKIRSLFYNNYLNKLWKTDHDILVEIKKILEITF